MEFSLPKGLRLSWIKTVSKQMFEFAIKSFGM